MPIRLTMTQPTASTMRGNRACSLVLLLLAATVPMSVSAGPTDTLEAAAKPCDAITKPSGDVTLAFTQPGRIAKAFVKEGQFVEANQLLLQQDDKAEQVQLQFLKSQADSNVHVLAAKAQLDQKVVDFQREEEAFKRGAAPPMELDRARLDVDIARLSLELAVLTSLQDVLKYKEAKARVDRMRLESPIAGRVERIAVQEGESRAAQQPVLRIVKIDPLWIDVQVPLKQGRRLAVGGAARVDFPQDPNAAADGRIVHIADVADPASDTLLARVEIPNPSLRKAGARVRVSFPPPPPGEGRPTPATLPALTKETR